MSAPQVSTMSAAGSVITRSFLKKFLPAVWVLVIIFVILEVVVRIWGYSQRHLYDPIYRSFDQSQDIPYIHKPNLVQARARGLAIINTDSLGLRAKTAGEVYGAKQFNAYRIAIVGDSVTFGEGVTRTEDTFAQVLEKSLNQHRLVAVKVFNYGASAYSVKQMAAMLPHRMVDIQPDLVVMAVIPSDFNLARTPTIDSTGYLVDQKRLFLPVDSSLRDALRRVHLMYPIREIVLKLFSPSLDTIQFPTADKVPESYKYLQQFKETARQHGIPYVIVLLPRNQGWGTLPERLKADDITYLDLSMLVTEFTQEQYMASSFDPHPSAAVHHRIGEELADYVWDKELKSRE